MSTHSVIKELRARNRLILKVPASSSNLGPGFDCLSLALALYNYFDFELLERPLEHGPVVSMSDGRDHYQIPASENLMLKVISQRLENHKEVLNHLRINISAGVPPGRGLGSSATAVLAACAASNCFLGKELDTQELLNDACKLEGHPDNVAASLYGALVVSGVDRAANVIHKQLEWPNQWELLLVCPSYPVDTSKARAVLPAQVPLADAVANLQNVALFVSAVTAADETVARACLHDFLHEPYRASLVPELVELQEALANSPALGCVLSGSGSAILVIVHQRHKSVVGQLVHNWAAGKHGKVNLKNIGVDRQGLVELPYAAAVGK